MKIARLLIAWALLWSFAPAVNAQLFTPPPPQQRAASGGPSIGTPTKFANGGGIYTSGGNSAATGTAAPANSTLFLLLSANNLDDTFSSCTDSNSDVFVLVQGAATSAVSSSPLAYSVNISTTLSSAGTFKCTTSDGGGWFSNGAYYVTGLQSGVDTAVGVNHAAATTVTQTTGTRSNTNDIIMSYVGYSGGGLTITPPSNLTTLDNDGADGFTTSYQIVAPTTSLSAVTSWTPSTPYSAALASFH